MGARPFRFAMTIGDSHDRSNFIDTVRRAEDAGFDVLAAVDHISAPLGVLPTLSMAAEVSRLRVSPMVIANDYRHPVLLARDAATIDVLSEGPFELGIGTGWIQDHYLSAGLPYESPAVRVDRLEEAIAIIKGCWTDDQFEFDGEHYRVKLTDGLPMPVQRPHPPLLIAGAGPRMMRLAGREADIVGITLTHGHIGLDTFAEAIAASGDRIADQLAWVHQGAGDRFPTIELSVMIHRLVATSDAEAAIQTIVESSGVTRSQVMESPHLLVGNPQQMADTLVERRERLGFSYVVFRGAQLEQVAQVVSQLAGT